MATFAAQTCKDISPEKSEYDLCVHGAFNALGRASVAGKYGLSVNTADSLWLCREQPETLQHYCYENFKWAAVSLIENAADLSAQFHAIEKMYATTSRVAVEQTIISLGYDEGRKSVVGSGVDYSAIRSCALLPPPYVSDCVWGFAFGLAKHGTPGSQHVQVIQFCAAAMNDIPSLQKTDCSSEAIRYLRGFYSPSQFKSACQDFKTELGVPC